MGTAGAMSGAHPEQRGRFWGVLAACAVLAAIFCLSLCANAQAIPILSVHVNTSTTEAGAHPDISVGAEFRVRPGVKDWGPTACYCHTTREITVDTPPGVVGAPRDIPQCKPADFALGECPVESQVGILAVRINEADPASDVYTFWGWMPLYNMAAQEDQLALFAAVQPLLRVPTYVLVSARTESDYGLEFKSFGIPNLVDISAFDQIVWGVPSSPEHDALRLPFGGGVESKYFLCGNINGINPVPSLEEGKVVCGGGEPFPPTPSNSPENPFVQNPTHCAGTQGLDLTAVGYELQADHAALPYPATTSCDQLSFDPSLSAQPTTSEADSASGLNIDLRVPQFRSPTTPSPSEIRDSIVTLPEGMTVNANAADGKVACTDAEAKFGTREQAECPEESKIGTLSIESSSFPSALPGAIYLGEPRPGDRYRVFLVADGFSLHVKLPGSVRLDPETGQVKVTFEDLPQAPFSDFSMHLFGAERGLLATPSHCGTYTVKSEFVPWASELPNQTSTQFFDIDSGPGGKPCPPDQRPFAPSALGGVTDSTGGAHTNFLFDLKRNDGDQNLTAVTVSSPPGFSGTLAGIPYCPDSALANAAGDYTGLAEMASSSCPAASQVGESTAAAGAGSRPTYLPGRVYLAGPYKGAPLSLAVVTPAVSGPYDLGNVVVRVALNIDRTTAQITAVSDPLPQIIEGIPLRLREVVVTLNRPNFVLNPTNCSLFSVGTQASGDQGANSNLSNPFQVANCADLDFGPRLNLKLRGSSKRRGHPAIHAVLRAQPGEANMQRVSVTLPAVALLDNSHLDTICTRVAFANDACPAGSMIGHVVARSPLLDNPLEGAVYLRASSHRLPDMVLDLRGQIDIEASARIDSVSGRLRTTFEAIPDVPVSSVVLDLAGGGKGLVVNSVNLCKARPKAAATFVGQNGRQQLGGVPLGSTCGKRKTSKHERRPFQAREVR